MAKTATYCNDANIQVQLLGECHAKTIQEAMICNQILQQPQIQFVCCENAKPSGVTKTIAVVVDKLGKWLHFLLWRRLDCSLGCCVLCGATRACDQGA